MELYWFGVRESDINDIENFFDGSITLFGDNRDENVSLCNESPRRINHNIITAEQDNFTIQRLRELHRIHPQAKCMFYNPSIFYRFEPIADLKSMLVCLNDAEVLDLTGNKLAFRKLMQGIVPFVPFFRVERKDCNYASIRKMLPNVENYVVQLPISCGGDGTFILRSQELESEIDIADEYLVMEYLDKAISVNTHAIIYSDAIVITPGSVQIVVENDNRLIYRGADFITYKTLSQSQRDVFTNYCKKICEQLQKLGYRGIVGIDGLFNYDGQVYIVEVNNRFQASTPLLNKALRNAGLPSIHQMNLDAFNGITPIYAKSVENLQVHYSTYIFSSMENDVHPNWFDKQSREEHHIVQTIKDGFKKEQDRERDCYLYKCVFDTNICDVSPNGRLRIYENILGPSSAFYNKIVKLDPLAVKIALLNQGLQLHSSADAYLKKNGGIRPATNSAIDLRLPNLNNMIVNAPQALKFTKLSPFSIQYSESYGLSLHYYDAYLTKVEIWHEDPFQSRMTSRGIPFERVAYLSTDRLRVHHTPQCIFKREDTACRFCDIEPCEGTITNDDIDEVVKYYVDNISVEKNNGIGLRHFLIGGQSDNPQSERNAIIDTAKIIRKYSNRDIYVMCLPYPKEGFAQKLKDVGVNEIAFNIEIFDEARAVEIMPGKGRIDRNTYFSALEEAVAVFGRTGAVRSLLIVGLEKDETFYEGIRKLVNMGVQPILSVFRPLRFTDLYDVVSPSNEYLYDLFYKVKKICNDQLLEPGPNCNYCQNNTLSIP